jgi:hypothetical protein
MKEFKGRLDSGNACRLAAQKYFLVTSAMYTRKGRNIKKQKLYSYPFYCGLTLRINILKN